MYPVYILAGTPTTLTGVFQILSQSIQAHTKTVPQLGHDYLLLSIFQFVIHQSP
jgi:hypothetical protein